MPIITFWSNNEKAIGQTISASSFATVMAMEHNYKILLISADWNNDAIESCFGAQESNKEIIKTLIKRPQINLGSGISGLLKLANSNRITPDIIHDYTKIVFKNRLEVLYTPNINEIEDAEENGKIEVKKEQKILEQIKNIILNAARYYDQVIVDLKKGMQYNEQLEILQISDVIVANVSQGTKDIEKLLQMEETKKWFHKMIWNICRYDKKSKYNTKNLTRTILKKQAVYETNYNTLVLEASQEGKMAELLLRFKTLKEDDDGSIFISKLEELSEGILLKYQETRTRM